MNENKTIVKTKGIGFCGLLTIAFIVLKLCGVINWTWLWVLAPLWISWGLALVITLILLLVGTIVKLISDRW